MQTWIALLRGINVGGHRKLPMKELVATMEGLGLSDVRTYIQSGNAVFRSPSGTAATLGKRISKAIEASHGFAPRVLVLSHQDLRRAIEESPFSTGDDAATTVHLFFLADSLGVVDHDVLQGAKAGDEAYVLAKDVFYLHTPSGLGRSKLATVVERALGVDATARNWRSATRILELASSLG